MTARATSMEVPDGWGPGILGVGSTAIGGLLLWLAQRLLGKAAVQTSVNQGFVNLMTETRTELINARKELKEARTQRDEFKALLEVEKTGREADRAFFRGQINQLQAVTEGMERLLRANGVNIPERKVYSLKAVEVIETTLRQDGLGLDGLDD